MRKMFALPLLGSPIRYRLLIILIVAGLALAGLGNIMVEFYEGMTSTNMITRLSAYLSGVEARLTPVTLIAINDKTRTEWNLTGITPHYALASLIRIARNHGAAAVLLDVDLAPDGSEPGPNVPADKNLADEVGNATRDVPLLMLVRSIAFHRDENRSGQHFVAESSQSTPYDSAVANSQGRAVWVSALPVFSSDRFVRKIRLWQRVCSERTTYPSPVLYVAGMLHGELNPPVSPDPCERQSDRDNTYREATLQFVIGANAEDAARKRARVQGNPVELFREIPASTLLRVSGNGVEPAGEIHDSPFKGRVVIIGVTHANSRDVYATPLGSQSGAMILANAVADSYSMLETWQMPIWIETLISVGLFILFAIIATWLHPIVATILVGLAASLFVVVMTRYFTGFDPAIRIAALALTFYVSYHIITSIMGIVRSWKAGLRWRAILAGTTGH